MSVVVTDNKTCYSIYQPEDKIVITTFKGIVNYSLMNEHIKNILRFTQGKQMFRRVNRF